jgi:hypothetical protein
MRPAKALKVAINEMDSSLLASEVSYTGRLADI